MGYQKKVEFKKAAMCVVLGVILGSFIKDDYSPKVLFNKFFKKKI